MGDVKTKLVTRSHISIIHEKKETKGDGDDKIRKGKRREGLANGMVEIAC